MPLFSLCVPWTGNKLEDDKVENCENSYLTQIFRHRKVKSLQCQQSKRVHFRHTATSFRKKCIGIPRCICPILVANIIWRSVQYVRPFFYISPFSTVAAEASSRFLRHSYVTWSFSLRARWGHFLAAQSYFQRLKKWSRRTRLAVRSIISNFIYGL